MTPVSLWRREIRALAQIGPGVDAFSIDAFSAMLLAILIGGAAYLAASLTQGGVPFQTESVRTGPAPAGAENPASRTLYALAVLVAAFVGFGIETFYPAPESPEEAALSQDVPPPLPPIEEDTPPGAEPGLPGPNPGGKSPIESYEQELDTHNQVASGVTIVVALLILVAGLSSGFSRLPIINEGVTLGGVLTLLYGVILAIRGPGGVVGFIVVAPGLILLLIFLYRQSRRTAGP